MPEIVEVFAITGQIVERDFTSAEQTQRDLDYAAAKAATEAAEQAASDAAAAKESARAKLAALGLTDDEINALVGA